jgi:hypothetical protein
MKKEFLILIVLVAVADSVSASFTVSNASMDLEYGPGETIKGWINLSLTGQDADSFLSGFDSEIGILDFLENNSADFSCAPSDCQADYSEFNREESKTRSLNSEDRILLGIRTEGSISSIDGFSMKINSDAGEAGYPQFFIDFFNDRTIDWHPNSFSGSYGSKIYGCYNEAEAAEKAEITRTEYCEKTDLPLSPKLRIGAFVEEVPGKGGEAVFKMRVYNEDGEDASCTASASGTGETSCEANLEIKKAGEFFVCISTEDSEDNNKYSLKYEQNDPCGFSGEGEYEYDFPLFAEPGGYSAVGEVILDDQEFQDFNGRKISSDIEDYIDERYGNNCEEGCIVPFNLISGKQQTINLSDVQLSYTSGISKTERYFNELNQQPAKIEMDFQVLNLGKSDIKVPDSYGTRVLSLSLQGNEMLKRNIEVLRLGTIESIFPLEAAAAVPVKFTVSAGGNITDYTWDFGDGTEITTKENFTYHTYQETGSYVLKVGVVNENGKSFKSTTINVKSPKQEIEKNLKEKNESINNIKSFLHGADEWIKSEAERAIDLDGIESELKVLQQRYDNAGSDDYVGIMSSLYELRVPEDIQKADYQGDFLLFPENVNPSYLTELGYEEENPEEYSESIVV